ncbi:hypothetical protein L1889_06960 [Paenalcaligenes niemegkensis]|uniref:hypothetical protein n=1 Tax=Paenalcaligenes niemegkensis TaxID=2895469 RepID=UPI001EE860D4|nr:hypothetical protein [Paenalcaligenes niemegkensis]MCQ9616478.1 hypothetical protein [Paenalcaligenes niemegkensis]
MKVFITASVRKGQLKAVANSGNDPHVHLIGYLIRQAIGGNQMLLLLRPKYAASRFGFTACHTRADANGL